MLNSFLNKHFSLKIKLKKLLGIERSNDQLSYIENKIIYGYISEIEKRLQLVEKKIGIENRLILTNDCVSGVASLENPISQPCTNAQFLEPTYIRWCDRIKSEKKFHRKQWEYIYILRCLEISGMIAAGKKGIGFGVGFEPIAPYLASRGVLTTATDLSEEIAREKGWVDTNQYTKKLEDLHFFGLATKEELKKLINFRNVDMNAIDSDLLQEQFDFTWSACAFEHLGSIEAGLNFIMNSLKTIKPGGIAIHTTEINVSSNEETIENGPTVIFRKKDFETLAKRLQSEGFQVDLLFDFGNCRLDDFYDIPPYSEFNHIKLQMDGYITTSFGLFIRKPSL